MKKIVLVLGMVVAGFNSQAQTELATYKGGDISVVTEGKSTGKIYLELKKGSDKSIVLDSKSKLKFTEFLTSSMSKYQSWSAIADSNGITQKDLTEIKSMYVRGSFYYGGWKFGRTELRTYFTVENGKSIFFLYSSKIVASDNQYMKSKTTLVRFTKEEIEDLIYKISDESVNLFINNQNQKDELFK